MKRYIYIDAAHAAKLATPPQEPPKMKKFYVTTIHPLTGYVITIDTITAPENYTEREYKTEKSIPDSAEIVFIPAEE